MFASAQHYPMIASNRYGADLQQSIQGTIGDSATLISSFEVNIDGKK